MSRKSVMKGKNFEREVARRLREVFGTKVLRTAALQADERNTDQPDLIMGQFKIEAKHRTVVNIGAAFEQVKTNAPGDSDIPVVVSRKTGTAGFARTLVTMEFDDWLELLSHAQTDYNLGEPDHEHRNSSSQAL